MERALCHGCVEDAHLSQIIRTEGKVLRCTVCEESKRKAITVQQLGKLMEPIMREHFERGPELMRFGSGDKYWFEQRGESIGDLVQEVLGQYFDFEDEIVDAIIAADDYWPPDGEEAYWDTTSNYVRKDVQTAHYFVEWNNTLSELKHSRRFFSPSARALFEKLFAEIDDLRTRDGTRLLPVARVLRKGTSVYRARVCSSRVVLKDMFSNPVKELGPPPVEAARAGRMNAEGVVVLYAARDAKTCLAEMRPALGNEIVLFEMRTTEPLRVLDFTRLDAVRRAQPLSYFQADFTDQVERSAFIRHLHRLISQPIIPGREADYLITQTMAEYLAHVHENPFDGILFSSVQREGGVNVSLFPRVGELIEEPMDAFRVEYVDNSIRLVSTTAVRYSHHTLQVTINDSGDPWVMDDRSLLLGDDWE